MWRWRRRCRILPRSSSTEVTSSMGFCWFGAALGKFMLPNPWGLGCLLLNICLKPCWPSLLRSLASLRGKGPWVIWTPKNWRTSFAISGRWRTSVRRLWVGIRNSRRFCLICNFSFASVNVYILWIEFFLGRNLTILILINDIHTRKNLYLKLFLAYSVST